MATQFPTDLPDWQTPLNDQQEDIYLRSEMDVGPGKVRKRFTGEMRELSPKMNINGAQRTTLDDFFKNNVRFERSDPKDDTVQEFRFLEAPKYQLVAGASNSDDRQYEVTLKLLKLP